jgi:hypothetical protein
VHAGQQLTDAGRPAVPDVGQADAGDLATPDRPAALFGQELAQV